MAKRILAVDDENDVLLVIKTALMSEGYDVDTASNGPDALEKIQQLAPDLIVLDVMMPGMTGFEVLAKVKADPKTCRIPVIMVTGVSERAKIKEALSSGTDYYIVKPFEFQDLLNKVNLALREAAEDPLSL
ncbi:MAG: response regulator [Candidatus Sumerlaeota bacterium]|nr:response regulator [Candidatus Sumerlaeota bacterium]